MNRLAPPIPDGWRLVYEGEFEENAEYAFWYPGLLDANTGILSPVGEGWFELNYPTEDCIEAQMKLNTSWMCRRVRGPYLIIKKTS